MHVKNRRKSQSMSMKKQANKKKSSALKNLKFR